MSKIESIDELKKLRDAEKMSGSQPVDYKAWENDMKELEKMGVKSTGSAQGDKAKLKQMEMAAQAAMKEAQAQQHAQEAAKQTKSDDQRVKELSSTDKNQALKANMASMTTQEVLANYNKASMPGTGQESVAHQDSMTKDLTKAGVGVEATKVVTETKDSEKTQQFPEQSDAGNKDTETQNSAVTSNMEYLALLAKQNKPLGL
jgi:hypothetical protein